MIQDRELEHMVIDEWYRPESEVGTFFILPHDDNHPELKTKII